MTDLDDQLDLLRADLTSRIVAPPLLSVVARSSVVAGSVSPRRRRRREALVAAALVIAVLTTGALLARSDRHPNTAPAAPHPASSATQKPAPTTPPKPSTLSKASATLRETLSPTPTSASAANAVEASLKRPLHFPTLRPGLACPTTAGHAVSNSGFGGVALGVGPVQPIIQGIDADTMHGTTDLITNTVFPPWLGFTTLWFSVPSYQGPWLVRAQPLGDSGPIVLANGPGTTSMFVPAGPTLNGADGYREAPGGTYIKSPGCYAWQVDGLTFSEIIIIRAVVRPGS